MEMDSFSQILMIGNIEEKYKSKVDVSEGRIRRLRLAVKFEFEFYYVGSMCSSDSELGDSVSD